MQTSEGFEKKYSYHAKEENEVFLLFVLKEKKMKKFIITIMLILSIFVSTGYKAYAAGEVGAALAVAGGSIGTAGLAAGSIPALPIAAGLAAGALIAVGINIALSDASKQEGMTKSQYMQAKLEEWGAAAGKTKDQIADAILSGATVARDGTIYLGREAGKLLNQFGNWLYGTNQVSLPSDSGQTVTINGVQTIYCYKIAYKISGSGGASTFYTDITQQTYKNVSVFVAKDISLNYKIYFLSQGYCYGSGSVSPKAFAKQGNTDLYLASNSDWVNSSQLSIDDADYVNMRIPRINAKITDIVASLNGELPITGGAIDDGFVGDEEDWQAKGDVLLPADGEAIALSPGLLGTIADQIGDIVTDGTIAVKDYVDAVIDAVNDLPIDIPVTDDKTGVIEIPQIPAIPYEDTASIEDVPDVDIPDVRDPIVDPTIPVVPDGGGVDALGSLTLDLKSVFPFCLPFDAVDMIKLLNVPEQAPFYHVHVPIPAVNQSVDFDIDLSPFDSVAAVARKMEIILFCVGLAISTRAIIRS